MTFVYPRDGFEDIPDDASETFRGELWVEASVLRQGLLAVDFWLEEQLDRVESLCGQLLRDASVDDAEIRALQLYGIGQNAAQMMAHVQRMAEEKRARLRVDCECRKAALASKEYTRQLPFASPAADTPHLSALELWTTATES